MTLMGDTRNVYTVLVRNCKEKKQFGRQRCKWEDIDLLKQTVGNQDMRSCRAGQKTVAGACEETNEHSNSIKGGKVLEYSLIN